MKIEIPDLICRFDNYTQSFEWIQLLIWMFSIIGVFYTIMFIWNYFRTGAKLK